VEQIDSGQIHLWCAYHDEITDSRVLGEYRLKLSENELRRQMRFRFERDRHRYLVTRAMVRTVLSNYFDVAPRDWRFAVNNYGRPSIATDHADARGVDFNLSHTDGLVVMGVARECAIGVDVENVRTHEAAIEVADRYFHAEELAELRTLSSEKQKQRFFEYWTLKESYIKARGMGLTIPLERFAFHLDDPERIWLTIDSTLNDRAERWLFWQLRLGRDHLTAVCAENGGPRRPRLTAPRGWP
jgi:4'-phosphopantetheinyl transferase